MPYYCIVPMCTNISGTPCISFHRLPLNNPELLKIWLIKIRRENSPVNEHSRVCSEHFKDGKKQCKMTDGEVEMPPFSIEQIKDDNQAIKFYTGFVTFAHLMAFFNFLGPAATNLCYGVKKSDTPVPAGHSRCLSPLNDFFNNVQIKIVTERARSIVSVSNKSAHCFKNLQHLD